MCSSDLYLTAAENLRFHAVLYGIPPTEVKARMDPLLDMVGLTDRRDQQVRFFSGGMKRRLEIARGLLHMPRVLFLDEPTIGLDPQTRTHIWDYVDDLRAREHVTMFLTTHYMDEAEQLCDRLVVMDKATIVAEGSPRELIARHATREVLELRFPVDARPASDDPAFAGLAQRVETLPDRTLLYTDDGEAAAVAVHERGLRPETVLVRRSSLEDVFLRLTGRTLVD